MDMMNLSLFIVNVSLLLVHFLDNENYHYSNYLFLILL